MEPTRSEVVATIAVVWLVPADFQAAVTCLCNEARNNLLFGPSLALALLWSGTGQRPRWRAGVLSQTGDEVSREDEDEVSPEFWATGAAFEG